MYLYRHYYTCQQGMSRNRWSQQFPGTVQGHKACTPCWPLLKQNFQQSKARK
jgi:hypothetical protein